MENASKALIMAGGILIALLIIGALLLMFNTIGDYQRTGNNSKKTNQIAKFNMEYESYLDDNGIMGADILSLINKIIDYNTKNEGNQEVNGVVDYNIKMGITISNLNSFNETYAYQGAERLFTRSDGTYTFGVINGINNNNRREINDILERFRETAITEANLRRGESTLKKLASIYIPNVTGQERLKNISDMQDELKKEEGNSYSNWNGTTSPTLEVISKYRQYSEFKTSKFRPSQTRDTVYADNGQIQQLFFEFDR